MKKLLVILLLLIPIFIFGQVTPVQVVRVPNATTTFNQNISIGWQVYNIATQESWTAKEAVISTATLTTAASSFIHPGIGLTTNATHTGDVTGATALTINIDSLRTKFGASNPIGRLDIREDGANGVVGSGTIDIYTGGQVMGSGTSFTTQVKVGDFIKVGSNARAVQQIFNNTFLRVTQGFPSDLSGRSYTIAPPSLVFSNSSGVRQSLFSGGLVVIDAIKLLTNTTLQMPVITASDIIGTEDYTWLDGDRNGDGYYIVGPQGSTDSPLQFWTNNSPVMTLSSDGNVSIGRTDTPFRFDVEGASRFSSTVIGQPATQDSMFTTLGQNKTLIKDSLKIVRDSLVVKLNKRDSLTYITPKVLSDTALAISNRMGTATAIADLPEALAGIVNNKIMSPLRVWQVDSMINVPYYGALDDLYMPGFNVTNDTTFAEHELKVRDTLIVNLIEAHSISSFTEIDPSYVNDSNYIKTHIRDDLDLSPTNEIQILSRTDDVISLSKNGGSITLPDSVLLASQVETITGIEPVKAVTPLTEQGKLNLLYVPYYHPIDDIESEYNAKFDSIFANYINEVDRIFANDSASLKSHVRNDLDLSPTNEIQTISVSNDTINLSLNGGFVKLPAAGTNYWTQGGGLTYLTSLTDKLGIGWNIPTSKLYVKDSTASLYATRIYNKHLTGNGLFIQAGAAGYNAINVRDYNDSHTLFTLDGAGIVTTNKYYLVNSTNSIEVDGSNNLQFKDAVTGTKTLAQLMAGGGWTSTAGHIMPTTITDEVNVGSITDMGAEKLQSTNLALYHTQPTIRFKDTDFGTGFDGQQYQQFVSGANMWIQVMNSGGTWSNSFEFLGSSGNQSYVPLEVDGKLTTDSVVLASGATINEFSTDTLLSGASNLAVPTEYVVGLNLNKKLNTTGTAAKATILATARDLYGFSFDGSAGTASGTNIIAAGYGGTGNAFTKFIGPVTSEKNYTLPNISTTILTKYYIGLNTTGLAKITTSTGEITTASAGSDYQAPITGSASSVDTETLTANRVVILDASGKIAASSLIDTTKLNYLNGLTQNLQTSLNGKMGNWGIGLQVDGTLKDSIRLRDVLNFTGAGGTTATYTDATNTVTITSTGGGEVDTFGTTMVADRLAIIAGSNKIRGDADLTMTGGTLTMTGDISVTGRVSFISGGNPYLGLSMDVANTNDYGLGGGDGVAQSGAINNLAVGGGSLYSLTSGDSLTAFGRAALYQNTTGGNNVAIGRSALESNTTGSGNTALGFMAGMYYGSGNTALTDPENSIYIGNRAKGLNNSDNNSIVIGSNAVGMGANTSVWGNTSMTAHYFTGTVNINSVLKLTPRSTEPTGSEGMIYSNSTDHKLYYHNGTSWIAVF